FVHESLKNIMLGVQRATQFGEESGTGTVNPAHISFGRAGENGVIFNSQTGKLLQTVEFDIAVSVSESASTSSGGTQSMGEVTVSGSNTDSAT
ncbi:hypothetical protein RF074_02905, partial [Serratia marcescens]